MKITPTTRALVRNGLQTFFRVSQLFREKPSSRVVVLCYHSVRTTQLFPFSTPTPTFEAHLEWLAQNCTVIDFEQVFRPPKSKRPVVAITFDDGYLDNVSDALPLLLKYRLPATFFITTGFLTNDPVALGRISKSYKVTPDQLGAIDTTGLLELHKAGMHIGAHSHTHRRMQQLSPQDLQQELSQSKAILEDILGEGIASMAYPYGLPGYAFDRRTTKAAADAGYTLSGAVLYRTVRPNDNPYRIPRFVIVHETLEELKGIVLGALDPMGWMQDFRDKERA